MRSAIALCLLSLIAVVLARPDDKYTDQYDNVDVDAILNNNRALDAYANCILDKGKCSPDGKEIKAHIREAMENDCGKCTDKQKEGTRHVIKFLINKRKDLWDQLNAKYDPERKFTAKYEKELSEAK